MAGLEDLYRRSSSTTTVRHATAANWPYRPAHRVEGFNPLCGDEVVVYLEVNRRRAHGPAHRRPGLLHQPVVGVDDVRRGEGPPVEQARKLIRSFKAMMSIHEHSLGGEDSTEDPEDQSEADTLKPEDLGELAALQGVVSSLSESSARRSRGTAWHKVSTKSPPACCPSTGLRSR